jgi:uncharacterized protein (TIGR02145 family)
MKTVNTSFTGSSGIFLFLLMNLFTLLFLSLPSFSQVVVTETEDQNSGQEQVVPMSDSAQAALKMRLQQHLIRVREAQQQKIILGPQLIPMGVTFPAGTDQSSSPLVLTSNCPNSDFSSGDFTGWDGCYGYYATPCSDQGLLTTGAHPVHKIIPGPGWLDFNTCDSLTNVFPGESFSARLGDTIYSGAQKKAGELKYEVVVTQQSSLFIYRYAVVLQTGGHIPPAEHQPDFQVMITNKAGTVLDSTCGYYYITAQLSGAPVNGWHRCQGITPPVPSKDIYWKDWTTVGMNLNSYIGDTIVLTFKVRPCNYSTHFGYAYISAYCSYITVQTAMCEGDTSATLTAPPGFTYLWSTGDTTASVVVPHPVTGASYSCLLTAINGCQVTIYDTLTYTEVHSNFTHGIGCAGLPMQFNDSSYVNQNTVNGWDWDFGDASTHVIDVANPTHIFTTSGDYNVTLISHSSDGCRDTITKQIHVDSLPAITNTALRQRICNNTSTNISLVSSVGNTLYTWTATPSSLNISGYSSNSVTPGLFSNQTLTNSGNTLDSVTYRFTPHSSSCTGMSVDFVVQVAPVPRLWTTPLLKEICDSLSTNIILTSNLDSTRFTWTCTANPGNNLSGYSDNITLPGSLNISQVIYNSGYNIDTVQYHITGNAYGCIGPTYVYRVVVFPFPDLSNSPLNKNLCSQAYTNIPLTTNVDGTMFTWTCTASGLGITGWSNNAVPSVFLNQQLFNSNPVSGSVTYHITPHANNCDGHVYNYMVTVKPLPAVTNTVNPSVCSGGSPGIVLMSDKPGSTFSWTATGSSPNVSGYSNSSGPVINQFLTNSGLNIETVLYSITATNNGCTGNSTNITVTVFPVPDAYFIPSNLTICSAQQAILIIASHVSGATFTWTASGSSGNVSGYLPGVGNSINQTLTNIGTNIEKVTYTAQPTANTCAGNSGSIDVFVNPVPAVTYTLCHDNLTTPVSQPIRLTGGIPIGGSYTGAGVFAGMFNPGVAGIGNHTITYSYSNYLSCTRTATQNITVTNAPAFFCGNNMTDIRDNKVYPTVKLGSQCWLASNLNFGTTIPSTSIQRDNCINEKYCLNNIAGNCTSYGGLYQWDEMMRYDNQPAAQGFCPPGWHVPTENDWNSLFAQYISNGFAGAPLKNTGYSGFDAFPSGARHNNASWDFLNFAIMYWSSTQEASDKAWAHGMNAINPSVSYYPGSKTHAFAIRCVQD